MLIAESVAGFLEAWYSTFCMKLTSLTFCIPAYHDEETIAAVVSDAHRIGKEIADSTEIIVINDASPDATGEVLKKLKRTVPELRVITHTVNAGYGGTIRELYYAATKEWLYTVPGDNQIPVEEVKKLLPATASFDLILGERIARHDPPARLRQSHVYNQLVRFLFGSTIRDVNSVRLVRTALFKDVRLSTHSAFVDCELVIRSTRAGYRLVNIPISHKTRDAGEAGAGGGKWSTIWPTIKDMVLFWMGMR
jgi:glycosyltransferase involved in cell wall biosynthesis